MITIAIDPGLNGGIAVHGPGGVEVEKMPPTYPDLYAHLRAIRLRSHDNGRDIVAYVERVSSRPSEGVVSAHTFGKHMGHLEMALYALGIEIGQRVLPRTWQKPLGLPASSAGDRPEPRDELEPKGFLEERIKAWNRRKSAAKRERKNQIKQLAQERFPHLTVTLATADALMILDWAIQQEKSR